MTHCVGGRGAVVSAFALQAIDCGFEPHPWQQNFIDIIIITITPGEGDSVVVALRALVPMIAGSNPGHDPNFNSGLYWAKIILHHSYQVPVRCNA